jgi:hypothetical protein
LRLETTFCNTPTQNSVMAILVTKFAARTLDKSYRILMIGLQ